MKLKQILYAAMACLFCLSLAACGNTGSISDADRPGASDDGSAISDDLMESGDVSAEETIVKLTENWDFSSGFYPVLSPTVSNTYGITYWSRNFYNTLVCYDGSGEIQGELAESWDISDDGLMYTFTLRDGVKFSDGTKLTAAAVKASFEAAIENLGEYNGSFGRLTSIIARMDAADDQTFVLTLTQPYYAALNDLTMCTPLAVVNPAVFSQERTPYETCAEQSMGTGPYMYAGDFDGNTYTFVRNPYYWGEAPEVDGFQVKVIEDNDAKVLALRNGEIDAIIGSAHLGYDAYSELSEDNAYGTIIDGAETLTRLLGLNTAKTPFDDILVRQAISYALDKETLCSSVFQGIERPAETLFAVDTPYCDVDQTMYAFDIDKANQLMDEAGWIDSDGDGIREKDGQKLGISFAYYTQTSSLDDAILAIADQLAEIGFEINVNATDMMTWYGAVIAGEYNMCMYQTYGGAYDPTTVLTNMNPDTSTDPVMMQVSSVLADGNALLVELESTSNLKRVQDIYAEVLGTIANQALMVPVSYTQEYAAWNSGAMTGYDFYPDSLYIDVAGIHIK